MADKFCGPEVKEIISCTVTLLITSVKTNIYNSLKRANKVIEEIISI
jgi:hypothetical protein